MYTLAADAGILVVATVAGIRVMGAVDEVVLKAHTLHIVQLNGPSARSKLGITNCRGV